MIVTGGLQRADLVGVWDLTEVEHQLGEGDWVSAAPTRGRLIYSGEHVSVVIVFLADGEVPDRFGGDEVVAYTGTYDIGADGSVNHRIDAAARAGWIGSVQTRFVELDDSELRLVTAPFQTKAGTSRSRLRWHRADGGEAGC